MNSDRARYGLLALQWVLGLVIFLQAAIFAFSPASAHAFAKTGLPSFVRLALAWAEMAAAIVFLIPRTTIAGGWLLLVVLAGAVVLHLLHGWLDVGGLLIYAAATWAVMSGKPQTARGVKPS
jgi:thiosulfate reductase cytochrome b subunit